MVSCENKKQLVFVLSDHENLGTLIEAYVVDIIKTGRFGLSIKKVTAQTISDYTIEYTPQEKELLKLIDSYADDNIAKKYCRQNKRSSDFFEKLTQEKIDQLIRPYIEKTLINCLNIIIHNDIPIFFKGEKKSTIHEERIRINNEVASTIFNFERKEDNTKYHLSIKIKDEEIKLTNKLCRIITEKPCWLMVDNQIYRFNPTVDGKKLKPFFTKEFVIIPKQHEKNYYNSFILKVIKKYKVNAKGFEIKTEKIQPETVLKLEENIEQQPVLNLYFKYDKNLINNQYKNDNVVNIHEINNKYYFKKYIRDKAYETEQKNTISKLGLQKLNSEWCYLPKSTKDNRIFDPKNIISWLNTNNKQLKTNKINILQNHFKLKYFTGDISLDFELAEESDWFDIKAIVKIGMYKIPFYKLKHNIINKIYEYLLPNGEIAILPKEWFSKYKDIIIHGSEVAEHIRLKKFHFPIINSIFQGPSNTLVNKYDSFIQQKITEIYELPKCLQANLRPYQMIGYQWLMHIRKFKFGGCLADDMGLGKTIQALALLLKIKEQSQKDHQTKQVKSKVTPNNQTSLFEQEKTEEKVRQATLIIMPLSLIYNWESEINKFAPTLRVLKHSGNIRTNSSESFIYYDIILTTYGVVRNDYTFMKDYKFNYIILDESQMIKNPESKAYRAIKELQSKYRLVLTGTPVENSLKDLWAQMSFLNPGLLGNLNYFKKEFLQPIEKKQDTKTQKKLQKIVEPFILRRSKHTVAKDLPALSEKYHFCDMTASQQSLYEEKKSQIRNYILDSISQQNPSKSKFIILGGLMKLRLLANHPKLTEHDKLHGTSGKFNEVIWNLEKLHAENHKVLIFSQFVKHINIYTNHFEENNIPFFVLTGKTPTEQRKQIINRFQQKDSAKIFFISLKAGGVGLNLTAADYVFMLDPWWNPAVESQAINRAHRIGQNKNVMVYKFISKNTIEEKILKLQERKQLLVQKFVNSNNPIADLSIEEMKVLLD